MGTNEDPGAGRRGRESLSECCPLLGRRGDLERRVGDDKGQKQKPPGGGARGS